ncbi:hypothetical protein [Vibrio coralliilyticus]|uniref:hypothetical protein n=1 Tax=Vibrio coralliilyticus TaxID=190893 RepID=UPI0015616DE8|nr:hypothetical protein [Vibrio coralliilyticus]NRF28920.1 hypothetical protein [Vibrio coralliilyticus]NRF50829.1 hypothetical protein [Vibrio coralliilyticus]NRG05188.1 hypothetical protein [Vibrio coralliilyticus]
MSTLQAIPTQHGIDILNSELKNTVTKYRLIGALTHDAPSESLTSFYESTIETSYYDDNGVLTFILNLPIEQHFDEYLHQIHVLDSSNQSVIECSTPKVALPKGIGGMVTLKAAISGEAGEVIFKHSEFVTETELNELHLANLKKELLALRVGEIWESHLPGSVQGWIELTGGALSRTTDALLWQYAQKTGLVVSQALKDAEPMKYAMYFGEGNGFSSFTLPNHHLGHFIRGNSNGNGHGETQGDAIREMSGTLKNLTYNNNQGADFLNPLGVFHAPDGGGAVAYPTSVSSVNTNRDMIEFKASNVVPVASENRPYTANLSIKIHRGWM